VCNPSGEQCGCSWLWAPLCGEPVVSCGHHRTMSSGVSGRGNLSWDTTSVYERPYPALSSALLSCILQDLLQHSFFFRYLDQPSPFQQAKSFASLLLAFVHNKLLCFCCFFYTIVDQLSTHSSVVQAPGSLRHPQPTTYKTSVVSTIYLSERKSGCQHEDLRYRPRPGCQCGSNGKQRSVTLQLIAAANTISGLPQLPPFQLPGEHRQQVHGQAEARVLVPGPRLG